MTGAREGYGEAAVALVTAAERHEAIPRALLLLGPPGSRGKKVLLKPNFNTADPFPASTHNDTLSVLIGELRRHGAAAITVGDRSGPVDTAEVLRKKGVDRLCADLGAGLVDFQSLPDSQWVRIRPPGTKWRRGFLFAKPVLDAESVVLTGCIKTHRFGAVFTMSLKLSIGMVHQKNMAELHTSFLSMRRMIAEVNTAYRPDLVVLDGTEVFVDGGPMEGTRRKGGVILAARDRVAIDAVALALLRNLGTTGKIMGRAVFAQEQIAHAARLGIGVDGPGKIRILSDDGPGEKLGERLLEILNAP